MADWGLLALTPEDIVCQRSGEEDWTKQFQMSML